MPDASGGIASGLYWVATGKMPLDDLKDDAEPNDKDDARDLDDEQDWRGKGKK